MHKCELLGMDCSQNTDGISGCFQNSIHTPRTPSPHFTPPKKAYHLQWKRRHSVSFPSGPEPNLGWRWKGSKHPIFSRQVGISHSTTISKPCNMFPSNNHEVDDGHPKEPFANRRLCVPGYQPALSLAFGKASHSVGSPSSISLRPSVGDTSVAWLSACLVWLIDWLINGKLIDWSLGNFGDLVGLLVG